MRNDRRRKWRQGAAGCARAYRNGPLARSSCVVESARKMRKPQPRAHDVAARWSVGRKQTTERHLRPSSNKSGGEHDDVSRRRTCCRRQRKRITTPHPQAAKPVERSRAGQASGAAPPSPSLTLAPVPPVVEAWRGWADGSCSLAALLDCALGVPRAACLWRGDCRESTRAAPL